jgi:hypothetical protein
MFRLNPSTGLIIRGNVHELTWGALNVRKLALRYQEISRLIKGGRVASCMH